tara:strand:- start:4709 stop:6676 length:1968 start_codon:yes stop_codon:yes gene_type:complete
MDDFNDDTAPLLQGSVESWVQTKVDEWREFYDTNYDAKHNEYYRLWRGIWSSDDKTRDSERSRIVSPALLQAVESNVAEVEEATFGRGRFFDISDDHMDEDNEDAAHLRKMLDEEFKKNKIRQSVGEVLLNAAVYGTGIAEVVIEQKKYLAPATEEIMEGTMRAVGVKVTDKTCVSLKPVQPHNFLIDPVAKDVKSALGCAIDSFVSLHQVQQLQEEGVYRDVYVGKASDDLDLEPDDELSQQPDGKVRLTKYYGLVPRDLLELASEDEGIEGIEIESIDTEDEDEEASTSYYVEAIVVLGNGKLLKAEANPYMMEDRPVVAFSWDVVPNRFWGMGVCEKGYNSQKALDTELRARIDALALTVHPMLAMDSTRMPRGSKPEIKAGKLLLTNGDPREVLHPFNFGNVDQITFAQAASLQQMVQQATGSVDGNAQAAQGGGVTAAGTSMSMGGVIKRQKRTLVNFQECFLIPFVEMAAYRYMQFEPDMFPAADFIFAATSSLGIIAREYEVTQLVQLLQTTGQDNPIYPMLIEAVIDNMNISNREQLTAAMTKAQEPNPEQQEAQKANEQAQMAFLQSQTSALSAQAAESNSRAEKIAIEGRSIPVELETARIKAVSTTVDVDEKKFKKHMELAKLALDEKALGLRADAENTKRGTY